MNTMQRRLGTGHAIVIGLASMVGAGVFFVWAPAAQAAGSGLLIGLVIAGVVASFNALSSAQLAMVHPVSGGTFAYARATVGPRTGFVAGWLFLAGKTASVGAIALVAGSYLWPEQARAVAIAVILALAAVNMTGIRSTAAVSTVIVTIVLAGLAAVVVTAVVSPPLGAPGFEGLGLAASGGWYGILQSAGLLFFCFAGYARMATLGEEVRDPRQTLPRAIIIALAVVLVIYATIGVLCVTLLGTDVLADSAAPLAALLGGAAPWPAVIRIVAGIACLGSLAGILAALSRTALAMARERELPGALGFISERARVPVVAEATFAVLAVVGVLVLDPARLVGFSACAVLVYYAIAHLSALRQPAEERWLPRVVQILGLAGCLALAFTLPAEAIGYAAGVLVVGLVLRLLRFRSR